jgi:hypothetical protein
MLQLTLLFQQFHSETLTINFAGCDFHGPFEVNIEFRDPWRIMKDWVCDPTLASVSTWFLQEKFFCLQKGWVLNCPQLEYY